MLLSAVAYELVEEAYEMGQGTGALALGLPAGALVFYTGDWLIDRMGGKRRKALERGRHRLGAPHHARHRARRDPRVDRARADAPDGSGVSVAVLAAVFLSNLPESLAATTGLKTGGWRSTRIMGLWIAVALVCGLAALAGYALLDGASPRAIGFVNAFAAGAILTMLADTMMPEAFERGGKAVGLVTTLGFGLAFAISTFE